MRAPLSIVIPTRDAAADLPGCLAALGEGLAGGVIRELVVSDGGSTDGTCAIAEAAGARVVTGAAGRGGQLRRGCAAAEGAWLLILHADSWPASGWAAVAARHMAGADAKAGYFRLAFDAAGAMPRLVAGWANLRARAFGLPFGDQGLLLPRALYDAAGGFDDIPLMEDVALVRRLHGRLMPLDATIVTSADRYEAEGWVRRGWRNLALQARYLAGADPADLARAYRRRS